MIKVNQVRRLSGLVNTIPFSFKRFNKYCPGIQKENYTIITASSGVGKSKLAKRMYVIDAIDFVLANPQAGIKLDIFYFCLEESVQRFILSLMAAWLHKHTGRRVPIKELLSYDEAIPDEVINAFGPAEAWFDLAEEMLHLHDDVRNPYGIFKRVSDFMEDAGTWSMREILKPSAEDKTVLIPTLVKDKYSTKHPEHYVGVIVDHISLVHPEKIHDNSLHAAIQNLSSIHFLYLRDKYKCWIVSVQQQSADKEKQQYTFKGQSIESKLEPSLDGLGDNKLTQRDANEIFGLFAPDRYEIANHRGYRIDLLEDNYRQLSMLKNRDGETNIRVGLFFDGATNHFEELYPVDEMLDGTYERYLGMVNRQLTVNFDL